MGKFYDIILGTIGAIIGFFVPWMSPAMGWFIGSTIGAYLNLEDMHSSTSGPRVTDFKTMNSKYGIPINRGYGTVRLASNIIWNSAVTEYEEVKTTCITVDGFLGTSLGRTKQCQTVTTYKYKQSTAFAFAEGPATLLTKLWGDGELLYDSQSSGETLKENIFAVNQKNGRATGGFAIYLGTETQPIDPTIKVDLGDDALPYRSIVYVVAKDLDLGTFGFRIPSLTAEICFSGGSETQTNTLLDAPALGDKVSPDFEALGSIYGNPVLTVGVNTSGTGSVAIHDARFGTIVAESQGTYPDGAPTGYAQVSPDFLSIRKLIIDGITRFGPFDVKTKQQLYASNNALNTTDFTQLTYSTYDPVKNKMWTSFSGGGAASFSLYGSFPSNIGKFNRELLFLDDWEGDLTPIDNSFKGFDNAGGTTDEAREIFVTDDGSVYWLVDGAGGVWINKVTANEGTLGTVATPNVYARVQFDDATNVASVANWTYEVEDDSFILYVDTAGTSPVGLYKLARSAIGATGATVKLPLSTDTTKYLSLSPVDQSAFQYGPVNSILKLALNANDLAVINTLDMSSIETLTSLPGGLGSVGTVPLTTVDGVRAGSFNIVYFSGTPGAAPGLDVVVTDLMTKLDGDPRDSLTVNDIDVSELTSDTVRGYPIIGQQAVRRAITPLQQYFMFDVIESDGKLKFKKRPQTQSFTMVENELAAHEYGKTNDQMLVPVQYERQSEIEMPRELSINYTDYDLDYNQSTQRYRRQTTQSQSNTVVTLPIVLTANEAAQSAEKLLNSTWSERTNSFKFKTGPQYAMVEPTDTGTITMNDGKVHTIRVLNATHGANGMMEFVGTTEESSVYTSSASGSGSLNPLQTIVNGKIIAIVIDTVPDFLLNSDNDQSGVLVGLGYYGTTNFVGGNAILMGSGGVSSEGGVRSASQAMTFGFVTSEVGHVNGPEAENIFDYETTISIKLLGGSAPTSKTESQALNADASGLVIVGKEIIAFTNATVSDDVTVTGTDISFTNATSSIDSTSTDFVAAGFVSGQAIRLAGASNNDNSTYWEIASVTTNQIVLTTAPTDEAAGASVTVYLAERTCTLSGGLLRGLYGTEDYMHHPEGTQVVFAQNLVFAPVSDATISEGIVTVYAAPAGGGTPYYKTVAYNNSSVKPWSPVDVTGTDLTSDLLISWRRRDKNYGKGLTDSTGDVGISETNEEWEIDIHDGYLASDPTSIVRTVTSLTSASFTYTEAQQIADWGAIREYPILVDIYQVSASAGRGFVRRVVVARDDEYQPVGETFLNETPAAAYSLGTNRMNAGTNLIEGSGDVSPNALRMATTVDTEYTAVSFNAANAVTDIEVLTIIEMQTGSLAGLTGGVILRGRGTSNADFSGIVVGLGGASNNVFGLSHYLNGSVNSTLSDSTTFSWSTATKYSIRARYYRHRVQAKVWAYGTPEPGDWQLNYYDKNLGPDYGWIGPFACKTSNDPLYHYFAWAHRGLRAA